MKLFFKIFFVLYCVFCNAQQKQFILIDAQTKKEFTKKDSLSAVKFLDSLAENNYYFTKILKVEKENQGTKILFDKGKNYNEAHVKITDSLAKKIKLNHEFFTKNLDSFKKSINKKYIDEGYTFSRVKTKYLGIKSDTPEVEISVNANNQRKINGIVIKGYEKVPKRFVKNLEKEFNGKIYVDKNIISINQSLQNHPFLQLERLPQTLFTKDSTQIYLFFQKKKASTFDGIIGFGNDKTNKFAFNGTLNVNFRNMFNGFETINLFWQRNPDRGQTFNLQTDIPYFLKSNIGLNVGVNIYRQDSTFASVKFQPSIYLHLNNRQKFGVKATLETSTVTTTTFIDGKDYNKRGLGIWYEFSQPSEIALFLNKTKIHAEANYLFTNYSVESSAKQMHYYFWGEHNFHFIGNHYLNIKGEGALINSNNMLSTNEMMRFGGWNSMRGFNENILLADFYYYTNAEYRYIVGNQAFFDIFGQYGQLNNKTLNIKPNLYSIGLGFNFFLPIGLMSFQISNGTTSENPMKFNNTKIHWGILSKF